MVGFNLSPIHYQVIWNGSVAAVEIAIGNSENVNAVDRWGRTALHVFVEEEARDIRVGKLLLRCIHVNTRDECGRTALHLLVRYNGSAKFLKTLLQNGADVHVPCNEGISPIQTGIKYGRNRQIFALLLQAGARFGPKEMIYAIQLKRTDLIEMYNILQTFMLIASSYPVGQVTKLNHTKQVLPKELIRYLHSMLA